MTAVSTPTATELDHDARMAVEISATCRRIADKAARLTGLAWGAYGETGDEVTVLDPLEDAYAALARAEADLLGVLP